MKTEISRNSHQPEKRYSGVYQQQGRMLTDADWNELVEILKERLNDALRDVVGSRKGSIGGVPRHRPLRINDDLTIQPGHIYVDGVAAQFPGDAPVLYVDQEDFPGAPALPPGQGYKLYADVWERTVTHLMDERLRDKGLHGADTCTRKQMMAQVKWCLDGIDPEQAAQNPARGNAKLSVTLLQKTTQPDSCDPCADTVAVDSKVGNYLFRVEVHDVQGDADNPSEITIKWSSENGAEQYALKDAEEKDIDPPTEFLSGNWAYEFFDETSERHLGVHLADSGWSPVRGVLKREYAKPVADEPNRFVRRWDGYCILENSGGVWSIAKDADGVIKGVDRGAQLQDGDNKSLGYVNIATDSDGLPSFTAKLTNAELTLALMHDSESPEDNSFVSGDFWLAEVREAEHKTGSKLITDAMPLGIEHHYLTLGTVDSDGGLESNPEADRKYAFPPLTEMTRIFIAGGDGQEAMPGNELTHPIQVDVANGEWPVNGASVRFTIEEEAEDGAAISLTPHSFGTDTAVTAISGPLDGVATCYWKLGSAGSQRVRAELLGPDGSQTAHPPVFFNAGLSVASDVAYDASVKEDRWRDINEEEDADLPTTVQEAIDDLVDNLQSEDIKYTPRCKEDTPETVRSLLNIPSDKSSRVHEILDKLLCDFNATHLPIEKNDALCFRLKVDKIKSVQDALDALCRMERSGGGCAVTVGVDGGQHPTLKDAFDALAGESEISLCLLPGSHVVEQDLQVSGKRSIRVSGAGSQGSVIDAQGNMKFDAGEIQLRDLGVNVASFKHGISLKGSKINSDNCAFERTNVPENIHTWLKNFRSSGKEFGQSVATDSQGNMLIAGYFTGRVDFGGHILTAVREDLFVLKLSPDGKQVIWAKNFRNTGNERGLGIAVDAMDNVVVTGHFDGEVYFAAQPLVAEGTDLFVLELEPAAGNVLWARNFRSSRSEHGHGVAVDPSGNVLLTGYFEGVVDADGKWLMADGTDLFVLKLEPKSGGVIWAQNFKNKGNEYGMGIAVDGMGNVHVTGYFDGTVVFGETELKADGIDMFVVKLEPEAGNVTWAQHYENKGNEHGMGIAVDPKGYAYVTGYFDGTVVFGGTELKADGIDMFVIRLEPEAGNVIWAQHYENKGNEHGVGIAADAMGNAILTGYFDGMVVFGETKLGASGIDMFVVRLEPEAGKVTWAQSYENEGNEYGIGIAVDPKGYVCVTGYFDGAVVFGETKLGASGIDMFAIKLEPEAGTVVWARNFANLSDEVANAIAVDPDGNVLVTGYFSGEVDFGGHTLEARGMDVFVLKLSPEGDVIWARNFECTGYGNGTGVSADMKGNVLVTGIFQGEIVVGGQTFSSEVGNPFVLKLEPEKGDVVWVQQFECTGYSAGNAISTDFDGNVLITGGFQGKMVVGGQTFSTEVGNPFVLKLEPEKGSVVWAYHFECTGSGGAHGVSADSDGNVLVTGGFQGKMVVGDQAFNAKVTNPFVLKLEPKKGSVVWAQQLECTGIGYGAGVSADPKGNVLVSGPFYGQMVIGGQTFTAQSQNPYVVKFGAEKGEVVWARHFVCKGFGFANSVSADRGGNVLLTGRFQGEMAAGTKLVSGSDASGNSIVSMFVLKLNPAGRVVWAYNGQSTGSSWSLGSGVDADSKGNMLVSGYFQGTIDFGGGPLTSVGTDLFIAKLAVPDAAPPLVEIRPAKDKEGAVLNWNRNSMLMPQVPTRVVIPGLKVSGLTGVRAAAANPVVTAGLDVSAAVGNLVVTPGLNPSLRLDGLFDALALSDSTIGGDIENNRISGKLVLMSDLPGEMLIDPEGTVTGLVMGEKMPVVSESVLNIRSNDLHSISSRIAFGTLQSGVLRGSMLEAFGSLSLSNNTFRENKSSFFGMRTSMSGNHFIGAVNHSDVAAIVLGAYGIFSDNQAHRNAMIQRVMTFRKQSSNDLNFKDLTRVLGSEELVLVNGDETPAGTVMPCAADRVPDGWLECNGSSISREEYAALFDAIKEKFGAGDGSTTFNLPNLTGQFASMMYCIKY